jgi:hypothetical protein
METFKRRARLRAWSTCCFLGSAALGCGAPEAATSEPAAAGTQGDVVVCNPDWQTVEEREMYVLSAIRRKLADYPDFAATVGEPAVSTCAEARAFMQSYHDYSDEHPGFDADQPMPPIDDPPAALTARPPVAEGQKILGGDTGFFGLAHPKEPVVHLFRATGPMGVLKEHCTGTFIAKNWIATAAHCLAEVTQPPVGNEPSGLRGYTDWSIEFADVNGNFTGTITSRDHSVLQLPDELWMGGESASHDFALLFLDKPTFDPWLPNPGDGAGMLVQTTPPATSATTFISGTAGSQLRTGTLPSISTNAAQILSVVGTAAQAIPCQGDSGGPIFQTPSNNPAPTPVLLGVWHGWSVAPQNSAGTCPSPADTLFWWRTDETPPASDSTSAFIRDHVKKWIGNCTDVPLPAGAKAMQCWGTPCQTEDDCPQTPVKQFCNKGSREYAGSCPICADSTCDCIQGQCLPSPG